MNNEEEVKETTSDEIIISINTLGRILTNPETLDGVDIIHRFSITSNTEEVRTGKMVTTHRQTALEGI